MTLVLGFFFFGAMACFALMANERLHPIAEAGLYFVQIVSLLAIVHQAAGT